ncbi:MAG TPA: hypothetical protein VLF95_03355, partial [Vicinamibacteria bacterium]|nr:hypothetical protein [Vicinamibacteria bacterium]
YLNGRRVDEAPLRPGDVLRLGDVRLKVLAGAGETVVMGPEDLDLRTDVEGRRPVPALEARPRRPATVGVLVAMWALFVPGSVAGCLFAAHRLGGGAVAWTIASAASLLLAGLGTSMALGLRALAPWARHLQIATAALALLACPFTLAAATVLLYMTRPEVKAAFEAAPPPPGLGNDAGEATFALSLVGMLALGFALTAIAALVL